MALVKDGIPLLSSLTFICGLSEILSSYILCSCYDQVSVGHSFDCGDDMVKIFVVSFSSINTFNRYSDP